MFFIKERTCEPLDTAALEVSERIQGCKQECLSEHYMKDVDNSNEFGQMRWFWKEQISGILAMHFKAEFATAPAFERVHYQLKASGELAVSG